MFKGGGGGTPPTTTKKIKVKLGKVVYSAVRRRRRGAHSAREPHSATLALPARHTTATANIYIFTVGLFYRSLKWKEATQELSKTPRFCVPSAR